MFLRPRCGLPAGGPESKSTKVGPSVMSFALVCDPHMQQKVVMHNIIINVSVLAQ